MRQRKIFLIGQALLLLIFTHSVHAQKFNNGDIVPNIRTIDVYGDSIRIGENNPSKVFLAFMRYAGCPVCNSRTHELTEYHDTLQRLGYKLIVVYESEPETLKQYFDETPVPFQVIGDPNRVLYKQFGVKSSFWKTMKSAFKKMTHQKKKRGNQLFGKNKPKRDGSLTVIPADFIISKKGIIEISHYGNSIADHLPLNQIIK